MNIFSPKSVKKEKENVQEKETEKPFWKNIKNIFEKN